MKGSSQMKNISFFKLFKHIYNNEYLLLKGDYCFIKEALQDEHDKAAAHAFFSICNLFGLSAQSVFDTCCELKETNIRDAETKKPIKIFNKYGELQTFPSELLQEMYLYSCQQNKKYEQEHNCYLDY